jgi:hypothetical protein
MSELFVQPIQLRGKTVYCVTDGVSRLVACQTHREAAELLEASILATTAILKGPIFSEKPKRHTGYGEL